MKTSNDAGEKIEALDRLMKAALKTDPQKATALGYQMIDLSKKSGNELALATAYKDLGVAYIIGSNIDSSRHYYQMARLRFEKLVRKNRAADRAKVWEGYAGTLSNIGNLFYSTSAYDSALLYLQWAVDLSREHGFEKVKANSLGTISFIYMDWGKYEEALNMQLEALQSFEKLDDQGGISRSYQSIAYINCNFLDNCKRALDYYRRSLAIKTRLSDERGKAYVLREIANVYETLDVLDSAEYYLQSALEIAENLNDKRLLTGCYSLLSQVWDRMEKPLPSRLEMNRRLIEIAKEMEDLEALHVGYSHLGKIYMKMGDYDQAIFYLEQATPLAGQRKDYLSLSRIYHGLYEIYGRHLGNPGKALAALEAYLVNHDSVTNAQKFQAVSDISTKYETEKKEATILQQQTIIRQSRVRFWLITGILALALVGGAILIRLTRTLRRRNREKEFLIKEIHHRVKNNLQVLSSLLHLQSRHISDEAALDAVREGQNRVEAMGLIHQKLYMGDEVATVDMRDYLYNLGDTLLESFGADDGRVNMLYHLDPLHLDVDTAIPLGLIINELVTNALKYAFPDGRQGEIEISLRRDEAGRLRLEVADNGVGRDRAEVLKTGTSFGSSLVDMLSKKLKGKPEVVSNGAGYATRIVFGVG